MDEESTGDGKRKRKANRDHKVKGEKMGQKSTKNRYILRHSTAGRKQTELLGSSERKQKQKE